MSIKDIAIGYKVAVVIAFAALLPLLAVSYYANLSSSETLEKNALAAMDAQVQGVSSHIQTFIDLVKQDAVFIVSVPPIQGIVRARENQGFDAQDKTTYEAWLNRLDIIFSNFGKAKPYCYKLRYIDEMGNEMLRVDFKDGQPKLFSKAELQNQAKSPYFIETMKLPAGQVHVSPFNLNREGRRIVEPYQPVVRFGMPVFNSAGQRRGVLILNVLGQYILDFIPKKNATELAQFIMADKEGYYLYHRDASKTWGLDLKRPDNLFKEMGLANLATTDQEHGMLKMAGDQVMAYALVHPSVNDKSDHWILLNVVPRADILSSVVRFQWVLFLLAIVSLFAALALGLWLSQKWFVYPLKQILSVLNHFAQGDTSVRLSNPVGDEIGQVGAAFNLMAQQQEQSQQREHFQLEELRNAMDIQGRVAILSAHIEQVASGDLSRRLEIVGEDDLARLGENLNAMTESLAIVASRTTEGINTIYRALDELQHSITEQSAGASEQAAAVNETTASLDQIKQMAAQTMEKVKFLGETAERSRHESEQGNAAVEQAIIDMTALLNRMNGIAQTILALSEQTQQIGEITSVVSNLAQQSKMLALNASIEAAKAGEAGKGFAVVAAEVRELAEQSQQSTAQVQKILQDIRHATDRAVMATEQGSKGVDAGMISVQRSGVIMKKLGAVVRETAMVSQQIAAVVKQQFIGLEQVTTAMKDINKVTAQFVVSTQQSENSSEGISQVADRLRDSVSGYKL